jgi:hypothetical protein
MGNVIYEGKTAIPLRGSAKDVSDGWHTFGELYEHRLALTAALMKSNPKISWRSKQHAKDGDPMFEDMFIVGMDLPTGTITYHYDSKYWSFFAGIPVLDNAPKWDGANPADSVNRLLEWDPAIADPSGDDTHQEE